MPKRGAYVALSLSRGRSSYASGSQSQLKKDSCEVNLLHATSLLEAREKFTNLQVILTMHLLYLATLFVAVAAAPPIAAPTKECPDWDLGGIWGKVSGKKNANNVTCNVTFCLFACS
jgi:hypothetical protein